MDGTAARGARTLGIALRLRRESSGRTQADVAAQAGISRQLLVKIESGHVRAELGKVLRVVKALGGTLVLTDAPPRPTGELDLDEYLRRF